MRFNESDLPPHETGQTWRPFDSRGDGQRRPREVVTSSLPGESRPKNQEFTTEQRADAMHARDVFREVSAKDGEIKSNPDEPSSVMIAIFPQSPDDGTTMLQAIVSALAPYDYRLAYESAANHRTKPVAVGPVQQRIQGYESYTLSGVAAAWSTLKTFANDCVAFVGEHYIERRNSKLSAGTLSDAQRESLLNEPTHLYNVAGARASRLAGATSEHCQCHRCGAYPKGRKVFIGHGGTSGMPLWGQLREFLENRGVEWTEFEQTQRIGSPTVDHLKEMLNDSGLALILATAEDELINGSFSSRENVIHEIGLLQGHMGFTRTAILRQKEEKFAEFGTNIKDLQCMRFPKDALHTAYPEIERFLDGHGFLTKGR